MADDSEQNKSEQPSTHKLQQARRKGTVARGMDLGFATSMAAFAGYMWIAGDAFFQRMTQASRTALVSAPNVLSSPNELIAATGTVLSYAVQPLVLLGVCLFLIVLAFEFMQTGLVFTGEPLKLDFSRLDPAKGLKRVFSFRMLIETAKNVLKLAVYAGAAALVIRAAATLDAAVITDARGLAEAMGRNSFRLLLFCLAGAVVFAAADQLIIRREFLKRMRMSRREVRREHRDREGEPRMKQRRQQLHGEFVKLSQSLRGLKGADVLITNPTHFAVALRYDPLTMDAPLIVSQGVHQVALRLRRLAFIHGVVIIEDKTLARGLYHQGAINGPIPDAYFRRVADIYLMLRARSSQFRTSP